jgi:hypothetical protein
MKLSLSLPKSSKVGRLPADEETGSGFSAWTAVRSSNVSHCRYNESAKQMDIRFQGGAIYRYSHVDESVYSQLLLATSPGSYVHRHVKKLFKATRIE